MADLFTKRCKKCGEDKDRSEFYKHKGAKDGLDGRCKECQREDAAEYRLKNKDKTARRNAKYRGENKEKTSQRHSEYYKNNKDKIRLQKSLPHARASQAAYTKKYRKENPHIRKAQAAVERAVRNGTLIKHGVCSKCPSTANIEAHHADYSKPLDVDWVCRKCHNQMDRGIDITTEGDASNE